MSKKITNSDLRHYFNSLTPEKSAKIANQVDSHISHVLHGKNNRLI